MSGRSNCSPVPDPHAYGCTGERYVQPSVPACRRAGNYPNTSSCSTHQIGDLPCRMQLAHTVYPPLFPLPQAFLQTIRAIPPLPAVSRSRCRFFRAPAVYKPFSSLPDSVGAAHLKRNTGTDFGSAGVPKSTPANPSAQIHADGQRKYPVQKRLPGPTGQAVVFLPPHKKIQTQNR